MQMCCIETYLARGRILLHPFFSCYGVSDNFAARILKIRYVPVEEVVRVLRRHVPTYTILACSWNLACTF